MKYDKNNVICTSPLLSLVASYELDKKNVADNYFLSFNFGEHTSI